jgi:hypothetical protein
MSSAIQQAALALSLALCLSSALCTVALAHEPGKSEAGVEFSDSAKLTAIGLPRYPGAVRARHGDIEKGGATFSFWGGSSLFRVEVLEFESSDPVDKVALFYQEALKQYAPVVDCTLGDSADRGSRADPNALRCEHDDPSVGGRLYKAGNKHDQRIVSIEPKNDRVLFKLVHLVMNFDD